MKRYRKKEGMSETEIKSCREKQRVSNGDGGREEDRERGKESKREKGGGGE